jgi:hypothetical protein
MVRINAAAAGDSETRPDDVRFGLLGALVLADGPSGAVTVSALKGQRPGGKSLTWKFDG